MYLFYRVKLAVMKPGFQLFTKKMIPETKVYQGAGQVLKAPDILKSKNLSKVLIITDESLWNLGLLKEMIAGLESANIQVSLFKDVKPDPTFEVVNNAMEICNKDKCQAIIGFGGGSVLDTAKTVAACIANNKVNPEKLVGMLKVRKQPLPLIAIPTTAGTGSEVTIVSVISDSITHHKNTIIDQKLIADYTILDPCLTIGLPPHITSSTAIDALTHAVEAYISGYSNKQTDEMALHAIRLIDENLIVAFKNPNDLIARENLLVASMYAGKAFTRAYIGYVHAFSHNIGGKFGVPHGLANAVLLPHVMEDCKKEARVKFIKLAEMLQLIDDNMNDDEKVDKFINYLFELNKKLGIPERLEAFSADAIDEIILGAFKEAHGNYPVPKYYTKEEARMLLSKVCSM